jgi:hypothetical protein
MSTVGFQNPTPANGETLQVGTPYTFCIAIVTDTADGVSDDVQPVIITWAATIDPDQHQVIGDSGSGEAAIAFWTITPTAAGSLTVAVSLQGVMFTVAPGTAGSRSYMVASAAARRSPRIGIGLGLGL